MLRELKELKLGSNDLGKLEILIHEKLEQTKTIVSQVIEPESTAIAPPLKDADEPCFEAVNEELTGEPLTKHIITEETWRVDRSLFAAGASFHSSYDLVRRYDTEIIINERRIRVETVTDIYSGKSVRADLTGLGPERSKITWAGLSLLICLAIEAALPLDRLQKVLFSALAIFSTSSLCRYMQLAARKLGHIYLFLIEELAAKAEILAGDDSYTRCLEMEADAAQGFPKNDVDRDPLVNLLAAKLGRNFAYKKDEAKNKLGIFVTHVHGRSDQNDPRSTKWKLNMAKIALNAWRISTERVSLWKAIFARRSIPT